jgi:hypothetical protein
MFIDIYPRIKFPDDVALSRCPNWDNISISHLDASAFMTDPDVISEYQRLNDISESNPHVFP